MRASLRTDSMRFPSTFLCLRVLEFLSAVLVWTSQHLLPSSGAVAALGGLWRSCLRFLWLVRGSEPSVALDRAPPAIVTGCCRLRFHILAGRAACPRVMRRTRRTRIVAAVPLRMLQQFLPVFAFGCGTETSAR